MCLNDLDECSVILKAVYMLVPVVPQMLGLVKRHASEIPTNKPSLGY